jgi:hypothetical protein
MNRAIQVDSDGSAIRESYGSPVAILAFAGAGAAPA